MSDRTSDSAGADPYLGAVLAGRYRVTKALGSGGMGVVYRAEHVHMKKVLAVKVLHKHMTAMPEVVARFEREAVAAGRIEHPNVAAATDFGRLDDGSFYLVLEYIEGKSLSELLADGGGLPALRALVITRQIAEGLAAAHAAGIIHRDLKPENVMLVERDGFPDWVKVLDFGIAKVPMEEADGQKLTQIGTIFGTPQYMSPEQGQGHPVDARSDLYALGVMLYEMLAGKLPFFADDLVVLITRHITEEPPPLSDAIHPQVRELVLELLEKEPSNRTQTASELVERIDRLLKNPAIAPPGSLPPPALLSSMPKGIAHAKTALGVETRGFDHRLLVAKVKRAVRIELPAMLRRTHRALLRPMRIGRQEVPRYALVGAVAIALLPPLLMLLTRDGGGARSSAEPSASAQHASPVNSAEELRKTVATNAEGGDRQALSALEAIPQRERRAAEWRALAHGRCALGEPAVCAATYRAAILAAPTLKRDPLVLADIRRLAEIDVVYEEAMRLSAHHLDAAGVDILFDVWAATRSQKKADPALSRRARQFLDDGSVRDHASPELRITLDLERAEKKRRCKDVPELVRKAASIADERAVPVLQRFASTRGCGLLDLGDCWTCLRGNKELDTAKTAAAGRKGPSFVAEPVDGAQ